MEKKRYETFQKSKQYLEIIIVFYMGRITGVCLNSVIVNILSI